MKARKGEKKKEIFFLAMPLRIFNLRELTRPHIQLGIVHDYHQEHSKLFFCKQYLVYSKIRPEASMEDNSNDT